MIDTLNISIDKIHDSRIEEVDFDNIKFGRVYSDHMFIADYVDGAWQDFRIIPFGYMKMSPANTVIHYAQSIFEGLKAYRSDEGDVLVFRPYDNYERMNISARRMCIPEIPEEIFMGGMKELLKLDQEWVPAGGFNSLYIRPFAFATDEYIGIRPSDTYRFMIITAPAGKYYARPVKVKVETEYTRAVEGGTGFAKAAGNYAASLYPAKLAQDNGYDQLIWTDAKEHKYIEESGTMNVMFVVDDTLITSTVGDTVLKGITRDSIIKLAKDRGMNVEERLFSVDEMISAIEQGRLKEAFGSGTAATIAHIKTINHDGIDYELPPVEERKYSPSLLQELEDIRRGKVEDRFNWNLKI